MNTSTHRAFTLIEVLAVIAVVVILVGLIIPRIVVLRRESTQERNNFNARAIANAIERVQLEGALLTNVASVEVVVSQLVAHQALSSAAKLTSRQISMFCTNGYLFFYGTYDD